MSKIKEAIKDVLPVIFAVILFLLAILLIAIISVWNVWLGMLVAAIIFFVGIVYMQYESL